ncbi:hypothetical protein ACO22_02856 [Paracoccidioides brasiliensis]|uniref:Uncharacterized protein n=1 Tax=Paracoccidioides brasiliensis TaxID=121759 RepID=A0A1D2JHK2_PARBR|nr:hypothetical protein ACO22_02856 [Paracoccidioides brasiliensis]
MSRQQPENMALSIIVEANLFTAMRATTFSTYPGDTLAHILGARLDRVQPQGPGGQRRPVRIISNIDDDPHQGVDSERWTLTTDPTVSPNHPEWFDAYVTQPIKIISPPYPLYMPGWEADAQRVFSQRSEQYVPLVRHGVMYTEYNPSTNLNILIGNGENATAGFPFHAVRNLAMLLLVYEPELDRMVRLPTYICHPNNPKRWVSPLRSPQFQPPNVPEDFSRASLASHLLDTCPDMQSLICAFNPELPESEQPAKHYYFKYDFSSHLDATGECTPGTNQNDPDSPPSDGQSTRKTLQFRLPSVLVVDPEILIHWARLLGGLVEFASEVNLNTLQETLGISDHGPSPAEGNTTVGPRPPEFAAPQPPGSLLRLLTAMEQANIHLDSDTARFWHRRRTRG